MKAIKKTERLKVSPSTQLGIDRLVIHPNDGFDLGMMTREYQVSLCTELPLDKFLGGSDGKVEAARVELRNECPSQTIQVNPQVWERIGMPSAAIILYDGSRLYLHTLV